MTHERREINCSDSMLMDISCLLLSFSLSFHLLWQALSLSCSLHPLAFSCPPPFYSRDHEAEESAISRPATAGDSLVTAEADAGAACNEPTAQCVQTHDEA